MLPSLRALLIALALSPSALAAAQAPPPQPAQVYTLPDGRVIVVVPPAPSVPPSYADPGATGAAPIYTQVPMVYPMTNPAPSLDQLRLMTIGQRLRREKRGLIVATAGFGAFVGGLAILLGQGSGYDGGITTTSDRRAGERWAGIFMGAGAGMTIGGSWIASISALRMGRDFDALGQPSLRGRPIASITFASFFYTTPIAIPLGWSHYARARRQLDAMLGRRPGGVVGMSAAPILDPRAGIYGASVGGSF